MKNLKMVLPFMLICALYLACNKDDRVSFVPEHTVTFAGRIIDESGNALKGAQVNAGTEQALTDENGVFRLKPILAEAHNAILHVSKPGYFQFSRAYQVQDKSIHPVEIQLLQKQEAGNFNATSATVINVSGGARLSFPANGISTKLGGVYNGPVIVFARYLDPTAPDLNLNMPGDLRALDAGGKEGVLSTFGMMAVEIESPSGELLQIASGSEVEISMPIPLEKSAVAPTVIPLWYYDNASARWIEEGSAQKTGNEYVGKVKHFSFWNCDAFSEVVNLSGKVFLGGNQTPLFNAQIRLTVVSNGFKGYGDTNGNGWFGGAVPKDEAMILEIITCGNVILYTQTIGPFSVSTVLPEIIIDPTSNSTGTVSGRIVDCNGSSVHEGYAILDFNNTLFPIYSNSNGQFNYTFIDCLGFSEAVLTAYDVVKLTKSEAIPFSFNSGSVDLGDIKVCNDVDEFIQYTLDGQQYTKLDVSALVSADSISSTLATQIFNNFSDTPIHLFFRNNNQTGTFMLDGFFVYPYEVDIVNSNLSTTVTTAPANPGDPLVGTFGGSFKDFSGNSHNITGSYRVIRE